MSGSAHQQNKPIHSQYTLHGEILEYVDCARYPGVSILKDLTWNTHIKEILTKANRTLGFIKRIVRTKTNIKELAYTTFVRSKLECIPPPNGALTLTKHRRNCNGSKEGCTVGLKSSIFPVGQCYCDDEQSGVALPRISSL